MIPKIAAGIRIFRSGRLEFLEARPALAWANSPRSRRRLGNPPPIRRRAARATKSRSEEFKRDTQHKIALIARQPRWLTRQWFGGYPRAPEKADGKRAKITQFSQISSENQNDSFNFPERRPPGVRRGRKHELTSAFPYTRGIYAVNESHQLGGA